MPGLSIDFEAAMSGSTCWKCGTAFNISFGEREPRAGDFMLCISCASLHVIGDDLAARKPTEEEFRRADALPELEKARSVILSLPPEAR